MVPIWARSRQATIAQTSTEIEYISADTGARILVWLSSLENELRIPMKQGKIRKIDHKAQENTTMAQYWKTLLTTRNYWWIRKELTIFQTVMDSQIERSILMSHIITFNKKSIKNA